MFVLQKLTEISLKIILYIGSIEDNSLELQIEQEKHVVTTLVELIAGKDISKPTTIAIGCTIK